MFTNGGSIGIIEVINKLIWHFKLEDVFPIPYEEEQPTETELQRAQDSCDLQHGTDEGKQIPIETLEEKDSEGKGK